MSGKPRRCQFGERQAVKRAVAARAQLLELVGDRPYLYNSTAKKFAASAQVKRKAKLNEREPGRNLRCYLPRCRLIVTVVTSVPVGRIMTACALPVVVSESAAVNGPPATRASM